MDLRLKRTPGLYLVGFMGCGKSTVGRLVADALGWRFVDMDEDIEEQEHSTIAEIFEQRGEREFRRLEADAIRFRVAAVERGFPTVLALGGGAFVEPANYELLSVNGVSIWLDCPLDTLRARVERATHRPLARDPREFAALYEKRRPFYSRADYRVNADDSPPLIAETILSLPIFR
jgi:shikimate kinase